MVCWKALDENDKSMKSERLILFLYDSKLLWFMALRPYNLQSKLVPVRIKNFFYLRLARLKKTEIFRHFPRHFIQAEKAYLLTFYWITKDVQNHLLVRTALIISVRRIGKSGWLRVLQISEDLITLHTQGHYKQLVSIRRNFRKSPVDTISHPPTSERYAT